jgi:hypothetical protein
MENLLWEIPIDSEGVSWDSRKVTRILPGDQWEALIYDGSENEIYFTHEDNERGFAGLGKLQRR